jgi:Na+-translocating ferredoxin:NAD+ oxidoreductase RnfD subunit
MTTVVSEPLVSNVGRLSRAAADPWTVPRWGDPRIPFAGLLTLYAVLGCTVLRFNRSPLQMLLTVLSACLLDVALAFVLKGQKLVPLSAYISGLSLALLLNYSHNLYLLFLPVYLTIASKYVLTYRGRHVFNPSMFGVVVAIRLGGDLISTAPAYQWGGSWAMSAFLVMGAATLFLVRIGRNALIVSFLGFYVLQITLRAYIMRWYLPPEALLLGTLTSASFFLFVFYMITDPKTSPASTKGQVTLAFVLTVVDLILHRLESLSTFFLALFLVTAAQYVWLHARRLREEGLRRWLRNGVLAPDTRRAIAVVSVLGAVMVGTYRGVIHPAVAIADVPFALEPIPALRSGLGSEADPEMLRRVDPRVQHIAKWLLSAGASVATADYDGDGRLDLFLTQPLRTEATRNGLYRGRGDLTFERVPLPALDEITERPEEHGLVSGAIFADYDNDGDQDLFLSVGYGRSRLLRNQLKETGEATFDDVTAAAGIDEHTVSVAANFLDFDRDGRLDLFIANALDPYLRAYDPPRPLSIFRLPAAEHPGDRRMLRFMHASWDDATNGGRNVLYHNLGGGRFERLDSAKLGMPETHWSLAVATGDLNKDGWTDLYVANDFGPDDLYLNEDGRRFRHVTGGIFGSIGRDTYKGMNASMGDVDRNGWLDIYVSNVHMPLQAEGSLLWMTYPTGGFVPEMRDEATLRGALNEHRFGWGGSLGDLNNDGWLDIVQLNGMVDDTLDKRFPECRNYWYVNEKLMRSGPDIHTYADMWGDLRGYCINGRESNRVYLSRGSDARLQFVDVADRLGWGPETPSRGALLADLDDDGDLDVGVTHLAGPFSLYRNTLDPAGKVDAHWLGLTLEGNGATCNRDAAGSQVTIRYLEDGKDVEQMQEVSIANAFAAQGDRRLRFGLGRYSGRVDVGISWCGGAAVNVVPLAPDRYHQIRQEIRGGA